MIEPFLEQRVEDWEVVPIWLPLQPPESIGGRLIGRLADGRRVVTALIIKVEASCVVTASGRRYRLGKPNPVCERPLPKGYTRLSEDVDTP
jgi:hypothetical protein